ncbi:hypothetical protein [Nostoc sp. NMS4]|uniref:hypothetical protein n=1 Tax=Nostoc sp. NMS4 TaxID=2815390 RepID=UPI0025E26674|nr:hypothetical protein [Nostoc sp. NMS4]MBN3924625.1 hypothetical protein [Nostoc sp. NMS4]
MPNKPKRTNLTDTQTNFSIRQPASVDIKAVAKKAGTTVNGLVRVALLEYMERNKLAS